MNLSGECSTTNELKRDTKNWRFIAHKPVRASVLVSDLGTRFEVDVVCVCVCAFAYLC